jgi:hypothetical protein
MKLLEEFEDTKGAFPIRIRISKKSRQHNGQKKNYKMTNNDLQNKTTVLLQIVRFTGNADGIFQRLIINMYDSW